MSDDEVDELLKAVETSPNGEVNYTGMCRCSFFAMEDTIWHRNADKKDELTGYWQISSARSSQTKPARRIRRHGGRSTRYYEWRA